MGQGSFLLLVLLALLSGALFGDLEETKYYQTPLVLTFDLGLLVGFALCLGCVRRIDATRLPFTHLVAAAVVLVFGLSASVMARAGMLFDGAPIDLLVGDGLLGVFLALAAALWWLVLMEGDANESLLRFAQALGGASVSFMALSLLPKGVILLVASLVAPMLCGLCLLALLGDAAWSRADADPNGAEDAGRAKEEGIPGGVFETDGGTAPEVRGDSLTAPTETGGNGGPGCDCGCGNDPHVAVAMGASAASLAHGEPSEKGGAMLASTSASFRAPVSWSERSESLPKVLVVSVVLSVFVADLLMTLFPISLFTEASPLFSLITGNPDAPTLGNLTQPALIAAGLLALFAMFYGLMAARSDIRLPIICSIGFFAVAVGFVTFPYHAPGGAPIGIAEAGRCIVVIFALTAVRLYCADDKPRRWMAPTLGLVVACCGAMMVADVLVVVLYQVPAFDYMDFRIRTIFGGAGLLVLVLLLLGPMHRVYEVVRGREEAEGKQAVSVAGPEAVAEEGGVTLSVADQKGLAEQRLRAFAEAYHLSPRESEIVGLVSQGRDVPYIEQELVLSKSTVKTHIRHIYEKCGVSSRQDLLDLLQDFEEES